NQLQKFGGIRAIAVMSVIFTVMSVVYMPLVGIAQGAQPIFGYNLGAARYDRVRSTLRLTLTVASILCMGVFIFVETFPNLIFALFERDQSGLMRDGAYACRYFVMLLPLVGTIFVSTNYFQAINKPVESIVLSLVRQSISVLSVLILPFWFGLDGIWISEPASTAIAFAVAVIMLLVEQKKLNNRQLELELPAKA
ncbi:MAG TPA: MATE family efflux transporter, partial [Phycisphaerae bacterium]|nr:MATE family efflux transporter [Phycisphaerae bacterium]